MAKLTRKQVEQIVEPAQRKGERPDLEGADLRQVNLRGADLRKANLRGTDLRGTYLSGANLEEAILKGARYNHNTIWPANFDPEQAGAICTD